MKTSVEELLERLGVRYRVIELRGRALRVEDVMKLALSEVEASEVCKTVMLKGRSGKLYAVMLLGGKRVSLSRVAEEVGEEVRLLSKREMEEVGLEPGAVCPLTVKAELLVDEEVLSKEKVNFSSGHPLRGIEVRTSDLARTRPFKVAKLAVEG